MRDYTLFDGTQLNGVELATNSSWAKGKLRWIELAVYRTAAGAYVLAGVGRSDADGEEDRPWHHSAEDPSHLVTHLKMRDRETGEQFIPRVNRQLLEKASLSDEYFGERVHSALSVV